MAQVILGTGHQSSVRGVVELIEKQLLRTEGAPRRIRITAKKMEVEATRPDFKGPFVTYVFRIPEDDDRVDLFRTALEGLSGQCSVEQSEHTVAIRCPAPEDGREDSGFEAVDTLSQAITLPEIWRGQGEDYRIDPVSPELLFQAMLQYKASDVHISPGVSPVFRIDSETRHSELMDPVSAIQVHELIHEIAPDDYWEQFENYKQTSFNYHQAGLGYARVSAFMKSGAPHCTFRFLPEVIPSFEELSIPSDTMTALANLHRGLLLVTGMTGSGKTTTVAALIDWINAHKSMHILTIENPVEYVHGNKQSVISQRNLGADVDSFNDAVTGALRHDPDVVMIGEMRDSDTIRSAINAAATGHLVISTLHANTASEVINRIVSFFDPVERDLVKLQLRDCVQCIICQRLVPKIGGGRIPALEILFKDLKAIEDGISAGDTDLLRVGMQQTISHSFLFEKYLYDLYKENKIDISHAQEFATEQSVFDQMHMGTYSIPRLESIKDKTEHKMFKT